LRNKPDLLYGVHQRKATNIHNLVEATED